MIQLKGRFPLLEHWFTPREGSLGLAPKFIQTLWPPIEFRHFLGPSDLDMELIEYKKALIEKLKKARIDQELSQASLAKLVDTKQPAIARMESGLVSEISLDFLV